jgi:hypothetical protein
MIRSTLKAAAVSIIALSAMSAQAAIPPANTCSFSDVSGPGVAVTDCSGYYTGNLNNAANFADVKALLQTEFPGVVLGTAIVEQVNTSTGADFNFATPVFGDTVFGVHWGGGAGGGDTAFYRVTVGAGFTGFDIAQVNPNPAPGREGGISNVALYMTSAIPEPETYALMLAGLGFVSFVAKRRRQA